MLAFAQRNIRKTAYNRAILPFYMAGAAGQLQIQPASDHWISVALKDIRLEALVVRPKWDDLASELLEG